MNKISKKSIERCKHAHYKILLWLGCFITTCPIDVYVVEGLRSDEDQNKYFKKGTSKIDGYKVRGNHQDDLRTEEIDARAVDLYYVGWKPTDSNSDPRWGVIREHCKVVDNLLGIKMVHGYDWGWDAPHHELAKEEV